MLDFLWGSVPFKAADIPDQAGRIVLVTGGNIGLGQETCLQLARHNPAKIYLAARTASKAQAAIEFIKKAVPDANIEFLELDLGNFESIKKAADSFNGSSDRLDLLFNNAGIMAVPPDLTASGYEIQFGTNHMGHALLTKLLLPTLRRTAKDHDSDVRIINLSSAGHATAPPSGGIIFDEATTPMAAWSTWRRYGQSKLANVLFARQLAQRYPELTSVSLHPGVVRTNLASTLVASSRWLTLPWAILERVMCVSVEQGALNQLWAATAQGVENGKYYVPVGKRNDGSAFAQDEKLSNELWEWTEKELSKKGFAGGW